MTKTEPSLADLNEKYTDLVGLRCNNEIFYDGGDYYLSYLETPSLLVQKMDEVMGSPHVGKTETAICIRNPWKCLILQGDHRAAMEPIKLDLNALKKYWLETDLKGFTSDVLEDALEAQFEVEGKGASIN